MFVAVQVVALLVSLRRRWFWWGQEIAAVEEGGSRS